MAINLKWSVALSTVLAILAVSAGAGSQFTDMGFSPNDVKRMMAIFVYLLAIGNAVNAVLTGFGLTTASKIAAVKDLPIETRTQSFASDPQVAKIIMKEQSVAEAVPNTKVVGPNGH